MENKTSVLSLLASALNRRDEQPNIELAARIVERNDADAVKELIEGLGHKKKDIRYDCVKALYEIGARQPAMVAPYFSNFLALLDSRDNRLQWGGMTALSAIADEAPEPMFQALGHIAAADKGSVVTRDHAVKIMSRLALMDAYYEDVMPLLIEQVLAAPVNQLPMYAELAAPAVRPSHRDAFVEALQIRLENLEQAPKRKRLEKVMKTVS